MLNKVIAIIASLLIGASCYAGTLSDNANMDGLTDQQKAEILKNIADAKAKSDGSVVGSVDPKKVAEWVGVAEQVAGLLPVFAEKTGIAAQKVLDSTPGRILLSIVLIKMFWGKIMGIFFLTFGMYAWWYMFKRTFLIKSITLTPHPNGILRWFGIRQQTTERYSVSEAKDKFGDFFWVWAIAGLLNIVFGVIGITN